MTLIKDYHLLSWSQLVIYIEQGSFARQLVWDRVIRVPWANRGFSYKLISQMYNLLVFLIDKFLVLFQNILIMLLYLTIINLILV